MRHPLLSGWLVLLCACWGRALRCQEPHRLEVSSAIACPGSPADLYLVATNPEPLSGVQASVYFPSPLELFQIDREGCELTCNVALFESGSGPGCASLGIIVDVSSANATLPPAQGHRLARLQFQLTEPVKPGEKLAVDLRDGCGTVKNLFAVSRGGSAAVKVTPELVSGTLAVGSLFAPEAPGAPAVVCAGGVLKVFIAENVLGALDYQVWALLEGEDAWRRVCTTEKEARECEAEIAANREVLVRVRARGECAWSDWSPELVIPAGFCRVPRFRRGDVNGSGLIDISDVIFGLAWLFQSGAPPPCIAAADINGDAGVDISDPIYLLIHLFLSGPSPPAPYPDCGPAPDGQELGCGEPQAC
jgi:hypothetical protein